MATAEDPPAGGSVEVVEAGAEQARLSCLREGKRKVLLPDDGHQLRRAERRVPYSSSPGLATRSASWWPPPLPRVPPRRSGQGQLVHGEMALLLHGVGPTTRS